MWRYALVGVAIGVAIALLVWPSVTIKASLRLVAVWALISGGAAAGATKDHLGDSPLTRRKPAWDWELTTAVLWLLFGIMVLSKPLDDAIAVTAALSVYLTLTGAVLLIAAWSLKVDKLETAATADGAASPGPPPLGAPDPAGSHSAPTAPIPQSVRPGRPRRTDGALTRHRWVSTLADGRLARVGDRGQQVLKADGQSWTCGHGRIAKNAGHERQAVGGVVPDRQGLPHVAEDDLEVCDQSWQPHGVHVNPVHHRTSGATGVPLRCVRDVPQPGVGPARRHRCRGT